VNGFIIDILEEPIEGALDFLDIDLFGFTIGASGPGDCRSLDIILSFRLVNSSLDFSVKSSKDIFSLVVLKRNFIAFESKNFGRRLIFTFSPSIIKDFIAQEIPSPLVSSPICNTV